MPSCVALRQLGRGRGREEGGGRREEGGGRREEGGMVEREEWRRELRTW